MGLFSGITDALFGSDDANQVPAVDPNEVIRRQTQVNRVNQITPFGSLTFSGADRNQLDFSLSPQFQALLNAQTDFGTGAAEAGGRLIEGDFQRIGTQDVGDIGQGLFDLGAGRVQPFFDQRRSRLTERLEQSGNPSVGGDLAPGSVSELSLLGLQENQFYSDLALQSSLAGPQAQGQLIQNQANILGTNIGAATALGNAAPIGVPQFNFQGAAPIDVTGAFGLQQSANQFNANAANQSRSGILGGLFDLGTAGIGLFNSPAAVASDRRLKTGIRRIGALLSGLPVYVFRYIVGGPQQLGVMADEAAQLFPHAVSRHSSGYLMVNYNEIG